jgi:hypothetical protein
MTNFKFFAVLIILGLCFHVPDVLALQSFDSGDSLSLLNAELYEPNSYTIENTTIQNDKATEIANVISMISRVLIALSGAIFGIKNIFSKPKN